MKKVEQRQGLAKHPFRVSSLAFAIHVACVGMVVMLPIQHIHAERTQEQSYNIPAGTLAGVLNQFVAQSGTSIAMDASQLQGMQSTGLQGQFSTAAGFQQLLAQTDFSAVQAGTGYVLVKKNPAPTAVNIATSSSSSAPGEIASDEHVVQLTPMTVFGEKDRDTQGYDDVYDKNYSSVYAGKEQIERYKGASPADLFKGMANVYSGDARNSGALDPNIRGVQGEGRVPLTIDGTEQALTVWRGYNGANNRNYIDPNLISSIQVVKGSGIDRDIKTGIGGGVAVKTLEADDVVRAGEKYGIEIKVEGATNSTKERIPPSYTGKDHRDVYEELGIKPSLYNSYVDPLVYIPVKTKGNDLDHFQDMAGRIALATKQENFDLLAAYAYRDRGNYFAGNKGSDFYTSPEGFKAGINDFNFVPYMANKYKVNNEVTNTSNRMESYLLKGTWRPTDEQALQFSYRDSNTVYGEIMPSRISWWADAIGDMLPQWNLSEVDAKAYNLEYKYQPSDNKYINLKANIWRTDTDSNTYTSGGFINFIPQSSYDYYWAMGMDMDGDGKPDRDPNIPFAPFLNTANVTTKNTKKGISVSNKMELLQNLNLTLGADFQREQLKTDDEYYNDATAARQLGFRMLPRAGRRSENQYYFNFDWQPTSWLTLVAGAKSTSYWSFDDFLNNNSSSISSLNEFLKSDHLNLSYFVKVDNYTQEMLEKEKAGLQELYDWKVSQRNIDRNLEEKINNLESKLGTATTVEYHVNWYPDQYGKYHKKDNPLLNGEIDLSKEDVALAYNGNPEISTYTATVRTENKAEKKKDHKNFAPSFSAIFKINPNNRLYLNYSETYRMPSMFESTLGFSSSQSGYDIKPEHAHNYEVAYIYNLKDLLKLDNGNADIKIAYFRNETNDVIERNNWLKFTNVDKQTIAGWELQSRYDNGLIFGDLSLVYNQKNKVCDESIAAVNDPYFGTTNKCTDYGFKNGYLVNMALPKYQANLTLGTRLFDNRLELGTRATYFDEFINPYADSKLDGTGFLNQPIKWDDTFLLDAYANYKYNQNFSFDLIGTNLTNRYYIDPLTRSAMPAPGRTYKVALTYKF